jgi:hypothetical protein
LGARDHRLNAKPVAAITTTQDDGLRRASSADDRWSIARDRLFFFNYQGTTLRAGLPIRLLSSHGVLAGDFGALPRPRATTAGRSTWAADSSATASIQRSSALPR